MAHPKLVSLVSISLLTAVAAVPAAATPQMIKQAKDAGFPAQNCQYCHVPAVPKKDGFKPDVDLNERGKWLLSEKEKQNAKDVNPQWLKNYTGK
jgi:hypothetical protein